VQYRVIKNKRVDLVGSDGDFPAEKKRLITLATKIQQVANDFAAAWLRLHYEAGNHLRVREWMTNDKQWLYNPASRTGPRIRCSVPECSPEMTAQLTDIIAAAHPESSSKQIQLAIKKAMKGLFGKSGIKSAYPRWMIALSGLGELPQTAKRGHIPFSTSDCRIIIPATDEDDWKLQVQLDGDEAPLVFKIKTKAYKLHSIRDMLWKVSAGEWGLKGVDLFEQDGKWFAAIGHSIPKMKVALDYTQTAFLSGGFKHPVLFRRNGWTSQRLRHGKDIDYTRRSLTIQRAIGSYDKREKLARRWRDFIKTWNGHLSKDIIRQLCIFGIGRLVVFQPVGDCCDDRQIEKLGRVVNCDIGSTRWDWSQLCSLVQKECNKANIEVVVRRVGEKKQKRKAG
jgi:hypothetical protein